jgi:uncharacterized phage-associated protein
MNFETKTHKLIARICNYCKENHLPEPGQVRATKLIYIIECEYYAWEKKPFIDLDWIFWHYGPWSPTLDKILKQDFHVPLENERKPGEFIPVHWTPPEFDIPKLKFERDVTAEAVILSVLEKFVDLPYNKLLDYVYFDTAPMQGAIKGEPLDFTKIQKPQKFIDPVSLLPPKKFHELRDRFLKLSISKPSIKTEDLANEGLQKFISVFDEEGSFLLPEGEIHIDDEVKSEFKNMF